MTGPMPSGGRRMFITDFDGTLFRSDRTIAPTERETLARLGAAGIVRVIATGRSLYSFQKAVGPDLAVDYVIFSTGAGTISHPDGRMLRQVHIEAPAARHLAATLTAARLDFMVHRPIPDNHMFQFRGNRRENPDFDRRIRLYHDFCQPLDGDSAISGPVTQFIAILPPRRDTGIIAELQRELPQVNIIRTTSPLDGQSTWVELFPLSVSKSLAAEWLTRKLGIRAEEVLAVGNDYNDLDLLEWSGTGYMVANAPDELRDRFPTVASHDRCGVTEAVQRWL